MDCRRCQELLDNLLVARPSEADQAELAEHLDECPRCAREHALAGRALASIQPSHKLRASAQLKERVMSAIADVSVAEPKPRITPWTGIRLRKPALALGVAAAALAAVVVLFQLIPGGNETGALSAFGLLEQAAAAEEALFVGDEIVHIVNEIVVKPVSDPGWAQARWLPIMSLEATGKPRFHQLTLAADVGKGYTVEDHAWYDPASGRFARLLTVDGTPIYANSFDRSAVYFLEVSSKDGRRIVRHPVAADFRPPKSPAEFLGIAAGMPSRLSQKDQGPVLDVVKAGEITLDDGSEAHVLKVGYRREGPPAMPDAHFLFAIRKDTSTIARIEFRAEEESLFVVRRVKTETVDGPAVPWNLAGLEAQVDEARPKPKAGILADMVIPNVSVEHLVEKADFETYLFSPDPPWTDRREIADILDIPSPPHRAFAVAYRAKDGRHVVLWQARSNTMLGEKLTQMGKVVYTSSAGTKVWSVPMEKWLAGILLQSAQATIKDPPAESRTGYLLETPAGTFATLGINGQVTEDELHALADSLVPARQCLPKAKP